MAEEPLRVTVNGKEHEVRIEYSRFGGKIRFIVEGVADDWQSATKYGNTYVVTIDGTEHLVKARFSWRGTVHSVLNLEAPFEKPEEQVILSSSFSEKIVLLTMTFVGLVCIIYAAATGEFNDITQGWLQLFGSILMCFVPVFFGYHSYRSFSEGLAISLRGIDDMRWGSVIHSHRWHELQDVEAMVDVEAEAGQNIRYQLTFKDGHSIQIGQSMYKNYPWLPNFIADRIADHPDGDGILRRFDEKIEYEGKKDRRIARILTVAATAGGLYWGASSLTDLSHANDIIKSGIPSFGVIVAMHAGSYLPSLIFGYQHSGCEYEVENIMMPRVFKMLRKGMPVPIRIHPEVPSEALAKGAMYASNRRYFVPFWAQGVFC